MKDYLVRAVYLYMATVYGIEHVNSGVCSYEVESGRLKTRATVTLNSKKTSCNIPDLLKDRWELVGRNGSIRIRGDRVFVRYVAAGTSKKLEYRCEENKGTTLLLSVTNYLTNRYGVLCIGFIQIAEHPSAEYSVVRLNGHGPEHNLLSPQITDEPRDPFPSLNTTCVIRGSNRDQSAFMRRTERRCAFPEELRKRWNTTYHRARHVEIGRKTLTFDLFTPDLFHFDCNVKDGDLYVLRSTRFGSQHFDGIICLNITALPEDPFYAYEMSRMNSGTRMDEMVRLINSSKIAILEEDCDWLESPARPEYLYS